jgi:hypothetical protein
VLFSNAIDPYKVTYVYRILLCGRYEALKDVNKPEQLSTWFSFSKGVQSCSFIQQHFNATFTEFLLMEIYEPVLCNAYVETLLEEVQHIAPII